jgi:murein DD-endopeptidase MepM/ murein hydrolase activator NlpD
VSIHEAVLNNQKKPGLPDMTTGKYHFQGFTRQVKRIKSLVTVLIVIFLTACKLPEADPTALPIVPTSDVIPLASATATYTIIFPTDNAIKTQTSRSPEPTESLAPPLDPDPLKLRYPTQEPNNDSAWRPPLYPTPWAPTPYDHFYFASPIAADQNNNPVADYRYGGEFFQDVVHTGIDIPAPKGTPVLAAGAGIVVWAGYGLFLGGYAPKDPYGLAVTIQHDFGYQGQKLFTVYGHMNEIDVAAGQHVETGDLLGQVGETGNVTGPHLHFEVRIGENDYFKTRNPELWLVPPIGWGVVAGRVTNTGGLPITDQMIIITDPQTEQNWFGWSYGPSSVNSDAYYQENLVIGSIPAGTYLLRAAFGGYNYKGQITIIPGMVSYFTFQGYKGFSTDAPQAPGVDFTPVPVENPAP